MTLKASERAFEEAIECALLQNGPDACPGDSTVVRESAPPYGDEPVPGGYRKRRPEDYDRGLCLIPKDVIDFLLATQPSEWEKLKQHHPWKSLVAFSGTVEEIEPLSQIIAELNDRFGLNLGPEHRVALEQIRDALDEDAGLDAGARVNTRENVRLTFDPKVEDKIQAIVETNFELYKRIVDDPAFGQALKNFLFDDYIRRHRRVEDLLKLPESKTLEFKSSLRWDFKENRKDDQKITQGVLKTIAAFLNTEGGDLVIGVADDRSVPGIGHDRLESDGQFMRHLAQAVRNGLGDRAGACIDPRTQIVEGKTVCLVSCRRSPEPVFLRWKGLEKSERGDFFVRSGPGTIRLGLDDAEKYITTRFGAARETGYKSSEQPGSAGPENSSRGFRGFYGGHP